ncbi:MAG: chorismate-binding protein, partial [Candidatus Melainabacteria bacterium]|nr:chorismate-binding protein [Candidatus Melainabacteria bacterium]
MKEENDIVFLDHLRSSLISFWIDSSGGPEKLCKQSFFSINPKYYLYGSLNEITLEDCETGAISYIPGNCFDTLEEKLKEEKKNKNGIFVGYVSYDLFKANLKAIRYPNFFFAFFDNYSTFDPNLLAPNPLASYPLPLTSISSNMSDEEYLEKVKQIKEEIKAGNVYQVNLTREYSILSSKLQTPNSELDLYFNLREVSPNPYGCFFKTPFVSILSSSPEEFLYIGPAAQQSWASLATPQSYIIRTRPIKGTLPKGIHNIDPKNKAENLMIVDLE